MTKSKLNEELECEYPLAPEDVNALWNICPGCNIELPAVPNSVFIGGHIKRLCKDCASKYIYLMRNIRKARADVHKDEKTKNTLPDSLDYFFDEDKDWFDRHPDRTHRLRPMTPEEKFFFVGRDLFVIYKAYDGQLRCEALSSYATPYVEVDDLENIDNNEALAQLHLNCAGNMQMPNVDQFEAMHKAVFEMKKYEKS